MAYYVPSPVSKTKGGSILINKGAPFVLMQQLGGLIVQELQWFSSGCLILGGDFNDPLNLLQYTSSRKTCVVCRILKKKDLATVITGGRLLAHNVSIWQKLHLLFDLT